VDSAHNLAMRKAYFGLDLQGSDIILWTSPDSSHVDDSEDHCDFCCGLLEDALGDAYPGLTIGAAEQYHLIELGDRKADDVLDNILPKLKSAGFLFAPKLNNFPGVDAKWNALSVVSAMPPQARKSDIRVSSSVDNTYLVGNRVLVDGDCNVRVFDLTDLKRPPVRFELPEGFQNFGLPVTAGLLAGRIGDSRRHGGLALLDEKGRVVWQKTQDVRDCPVVSPDQSAFPHFTGGGVRKMDFAGNDLGLLPVPPSNYSKLCWDEAGLVAFSSELSHNLETGETFRYPPEFAGCGSYRLKFGHGLVVFPGKDVTAVLDYRNPESSARILPAADDAFPSSDGAVVLCQKLSGSLTRVSLVSSDGKITKLRGNKKKEKLCHCGTIMRRGENQP